MTHVGGDSRSNAAGRCRRSCNEVFQRPQAVDLPPRQAGDQDQVLVRARPAQSATPPAWLRRRRAWRSMTVARHTLELEHEVAQRLGKHREVPARMTAR